MCLDLFKSSMAPYTLSLLLLQIELNLVVVYAVPAPTESSVLSYISRPGPTMDVLDHILGGDQTTAAPTQFHDPILGQPCTGPGCESGILNDADVLRPRPQPAPKPDVAQVFQYSKPPVVYGPPRDSQPTDSIQNAVRAAVRGYLAAHPSLSLPQVQDVVVDPAHVLVGGGAAAAHPVGAAPPASIADAQMLVQPVASVVDVSPRPSHVHTAVGAGVGALAPRVVVLLPSAPPPFAEEGRDLGEQMCGAVEYELGEEMCCNGTVQQVQEGAGNAFRCCGRAAYDTRAQGCCEYDVPSTAALRHIVTKVIDLATQTCCNATPAQAQQQYLQCCGHMSYDPRTSMCCHGRVVKGNAGHGYKCCGTESFVIGAEACCGNAVVYDPKDARCCGSKITSTRTNSHLACCGSQPYQRSSGTMCCRGQLHRVTGQNPSRLACCGAAKYDTWSQQCCSGAISPRTTHPCAPGPGAFQGAQQQHPRMQGPVSGRMHYPGYTPSQGDPFAANPKISNPVVRGGYPGHGNPPPANRVGVSGADYSPDAGYAPINVPTSRGPFAGNAYLRDTAPSSRTALPGQPAPIPPYRSDSTVTGGGWLDQADIFLNSMGDKNATTGTPSPP